MFSEASVSHSVHGRGTSLSGGGWGLCQEGEVDSVRKGVSI